MINSLVIGSVFLLISEWCTRKFFVINHVSDINDVSYLQAFLVGCFQCLALCPGFSRSGATISGGLLVGLNRYVSTVFSFLLAVPIMFSAAVLVLYKSVYIMSLEYCPAFIMGFFIAFVVSLCTVKVFIYVIQYISFIPFVIYRLILSGLIYFLNF